MLGNPWKSDFPDRWFHSAPGIPIVVLGCFAWSFILGPTFTQSAPVQSRLADTDIGNEGSPWIETIAPGIRRIGTQQPSAKFQAMEVPLVMPDGASYLLLGPNTLFLVDSVSHQLLAKRTLDPSENRRYEISRDGSRIIIASDRRLPSAGIDQEIDWTAIEGRVEKLQALIQGNEIQVEVLDKELELLGRFTIQDSRELQNIEDLPESVRCVSMSQDGQKVLVGTTKACHVIPWEDDENRMTHRSPMITNVWEIESSQVLLQSRSGFRIWDIQHDIVNDLSSKVVAEGSTLLSSSPDHAWLFFWRPGNPQILSHDLKQPVALQATKDLTFSRMCFAPDNQRLVAFVRDESNDNRTGFLQWSLPSGKLIKAEWFSDPTLWFTCRLIADGKSMLVSQRDGVHSVVRLTQPLEPQLQAAFRHLKLTWKLTFGNHDKTLFAFGAGLLDVNSGSYDPTIRFPEYPSPVARQLLVTRQLDLGRIQVSLRDLERDKASALFTHRVFDQSVINQLLSVMGRAELEKTWGGRLLHARFSQDGQQVHCLFQELAKGLRLISWDRGTRSIQTDAIISRFPERHFGYSPSSYAISEDGTLVVFNDHGKVVGWDTKAGEERFVLERQSTTQLSLSADSSYLAVMNAEDAWSAGERLTIYETQAGRRLKVIPGKSLRAAFSSHSNRLAVVPTDPSEPVRVYRADDLQTLLEYRPPLTDRERLLKRRDMAISDDGKQLAIGWNDTRIELWEIDRIDPDAR